MSEFPALVEKNELQLSEPDKRRIVKLFQEKAVSYLSHDKELGPFLLYYVGDNLEDIALKTNLPRDVILATAIHYNWPEKAKNLKKDTMGVLDIQKNLANTLLVATYKALMDDLGQVIAGKKTAKEVGLIPKNLASLEKLIGMVEKVNKLEEAKEAPPPAQTTIHATNVQVNQQLPAPKEEKNEEPVNRLKVLQAIVENEG